VFGVVFSGACTTYFSVWFSNAILKCVYVGGFRILFLRLFLVVLAPLIFLCGFPKRVFNVFLLINFGQCF
jgi:hypothetical protein